MLRPADQTHGSGRGQRQVHEAFRHIAVAAMGHGIELQVVPRGKSLRIRLVGDDADRAGLGTCAVQGTLGTCKHLDAGDVVDVHVKRAVDHRDRLFVQVRANTRLGARMVAVATGVHTTHVDVRRTRLTAVALTVGARHLHARQVLHVRVEVDDMQFGQFLGAECLDADRNVLQVFRALLRGHNHLFKATGRLVLGSIDGWNSGKHARDGSRERRVARQSRPVARGDGCFSVMAHGSSPSSH